ncbi:MAG: hypothetical protein QW816_01740 [Desulfurococcaceae archaeon]
MKSMKCLDRSYLEFLVYLNGMEMNGFKIYDLFKALYSGDIEIDECYRSLSRIYMVLEHLLGDPQLSLYKLSEITRGTRASDFFREYGNIILTSGDTSTYVHNVLKSEFNVLKAKISELLRIIEVIYEAVLVAVLGLSTLSLMPIWPFPPLIGILVLEFAGLTGYFTSLMVMKKLYYHIIPPVIIVDTVLLLSSVSLLFVNYIGAIIYSMVIITMHFLTRRFINPILNMEKESLRLLNDTYSRTIQGETVDVALVDSLGKSKLKEYRLLWYGILSGSGSKEILKKINLPVLAGKVLSLLTGLLQYSDLGSLYVISVSHFVDEVNGLRKFVEERSKYYLLYSTILALLMATSYYMFTRFSTIIGDLRILGIYGYLGVLSTSVPACVLRSTGFTSSKASILVVIFALIVYLVITHGVI